jgi:hypothetical protein
MEFIESERGNQKLKIKLKTICGGQLSGGLLSRGPSDRKESCTSHRLQHKLERHFGDLITIQPQHGQGMSNIIYSSAISTPEAIG